MFCNKRSHRNEKPTLATTREKPACSNKDPMQPKKKNFIKKKGMEIGKENIKLPLFADDIIIFVGNPNESTKKLPRTNN